MYLRLLKKTKKKTNPRKVVHKQFQHNTADGGIDVQFNLDYDGQNVSITAIQIHGNYKTGIPESPMLEWHNGKLLFCKNFQMEKNGEIIDAIEYIDTPLSNDIVKKILEIKDEEKPKFVN